MTEDELIPPQIVIVLELLPSCGMNFRKAGVKAGYSASYARKIVGRFAREPRLQKALHARMRRLLAEAQESDRLIVERVLQRQHFDAHPINGSYLIGRSPFAVQG
jgi:hypothetical protein